MARAARLTSAVGAATGGLSATHWFLPASLLALPLELGAETVLIGAVEVVLIGELHELHGRPATGDARARANAYLARLVRAARGGRCQCRRLQLAAGHRRPGGGPPRHDPETLPLGPRPRPRS